MYGQGGGEAVALSGGVSTVAGITVLPNTGGSMALTILSITAMIAGGLIVGSFVLTRVLARLSR